MLCQYSAFYAQKVTSKGIDEYFNLRFEYSIYYPANILKPQPESYNGDGRVFTDMQNRNVLVVYGCRSVDIDTDLPLPFEQVYKDELKGGRFQTHPNRKVSYSKFTKKYFIITGIDGENIFYQKTILLSGKHNDCIAQAILTYPIVEKSMYDELVKQLFSSFKEVEMKKDFKYLK